MGAYKAVNTALSINKDNVVVYKEILHNQSAMEMLKKKNIKCVENIEDINKIFIGINNELRGYSVNYSPFIKYIDEDKFEVFKEHLIKWYNANKYNNYNGYEVNVV